MNLEKIISNNELSLKAIGLIAYLSVHHPDLEGVDKTTLASEKKIGKDALKSAFDELMKADIIRLTNIKNNGKFMYEYSVNEIYI